VNKDWNGYRCLTYLQADCSCRRAECIGGGGGGHSTSVECLFSIW